MEELLGVREASDAGVEDDLVGVVPGDLDGEIARVVEADLVEGGGGRGGGGEVKGHWHLVALLTWHCHLNPEEMIPVLDDLRLQRLLHVLHHRSGRRLQLQRVLRYSIFIPSSFCVFSSSVPSFCVFPSSSFCASIPSFCAFVRKGVGDGVSVGGRQREVAAGRVTPRGPDAAHLQALALVGAVFPRQRTRGVGMGRNHVRVMNQDPCHGHGHERRQTADRGDGPPSGLRGLPVRAHLGFGRGWARAWA